MPNVIQYNSGATPAGCLRRGNMLVGNNTADYGGTFYTGITPGASGYTIYANKPTGGPSIVCPPDDAGLIYWARAFSGTTYATAEECLNYFATQGDKICVNRDYEGITLNGLTINLDAGFSPSYPRSGIPWYDLSGSNDGSLANGPSFNPSSGGGILFDGTNDVVNFPVGYNATTSGINGYHSVEMWVYPERVTGDNGMLRSFNGGGGTGKNLHYIIRSGKFHLGWYSIDTPGTRTITPNTWYQVVFLFDTDDRQKIYVNGTIDSTGAVLSGNPNLVDGKFYNGGVGPLNFGFYSGSSYFKGTLSMLRIYNRSLSPSEVYQNFTSQKHRFGFQSTITNGLIMSLDAQNPNSYNPFNTSSMVWYDTSGNNYNGTLTNGASYSGGSMVFDGTNDYVSVLLPSPTVISSFSYNIWFNADVVTGAYRTIIDFNNDSFLLTIAPGGSVYIWNPQNNTGFSPNVNTWYNIQLTHNFGEPYYTYVNGQLVNTFSGSMTTTYTACSIGIGAGFITGTCGTKNPDEFFDGKISVASVYNRGLSEAEVLQNYNAQKSQFGL